MRTYQDLIRTHQLERTQALAERLADFLVRAWRELLAPPRPAYLIVAERSAHRRGEMSHLFAPR